MHTKTHAHAWHRPHAEAMIPRPTIYAQICRHIHIHMCINAQMYIYIHTCIYIHILCPHTYTHTHIYTHAYKMYIWTHAKHFWNDGAASTAREAQLDAKKLCPSACPLQSGGGYLSWPAPQSSVHEERQISAEQPQPTAAHHTITTARRPDHIRLSALVWSQSTQFIVHASSQLGCGPPKRGHFSVCVVFTTQSPLCSQNAIWRKKHYHLFQELSSYSSALIFGRLVCRSTAREFNYVGSQNKEIWQTTP